LPRNSGKSKKGNDEQLHSISDLRTSTVRMFYASTRRSLQREFDAVTQRSLLIERHVTVLAALVLILIAVAFAPYVIFALRR